MDPAPESESIYLRILSQESISDKAQAAPGRGHTSATASGFGRKSYRGPIARENTHANQTVSAAFSFDRCKPATGARERVLKYDLGSYCRLAHQTVR